MATRLNTSRRALMKGAMAALGASAPAMSATARADDAAIVALAARLDELIRRDWELAAALDDAEAALQVAEAAIPAAGRYQEGDEALHLPGATQAQREHLRSGSAELSPAYDVEPVEAMRAGRIKNPIAVLGDPRFPAGDIVTTNFPPSREQLGRANQIVAAFDAHERQFGMRKLKVTAVLAREACDMHASLLSRVAAEILALPARSAAGARAKGVALHLVSTDEMADAAEVLVQDLCAATDAALQVLKS